jgi:hypothetical protein
MRYLAQEFDWNYWDYKMEMGKAPSSDDQEELGKNKKKGKKKSDNSQNDSKDKLTKDSSSDSKNNKQESGKTNNNNNRQCKDKSKNRNDAGSAAAKTDQSTLKACGLLTQAEKDGCHAKGLCFYCGKPGHGIHDCPGLAVNDRNKATGRVTYTFTATDGDGKQTQAVGGSKPVTDRLTRETPDQLS